MSSIFSHYHSFLSSIDSIDIDIKVDSLPIDLYYSSYCSYSSTLFLYLLFLHLIVYSLLQIDQSSSSFMIQPSTNSQIFLQPFQLICSIYNKQTKQSRRMKKYINCICITREAGQQIEEQPELSIEMKSSIQQSIQINYKQPIYHFRQDLTKYRNSRTRSRSRKNKNESD